MQTLSDVYNLPLMASGEKTQARHILAAIRTLGRIEQEQRPASPDERETLMRFAGFGKVALSLFPNPLTGRYKDESWQELGEELRALLSSEEYDSAKRTTFTAFYTSPVVIGAMHDALAHLGVPENAAVLEPGCGNGRFISQAPQDMRFIGVELDSLSGRIARALHPGHDIRIENFRDTRLLENRIDAVIGNVPFADIRLDYGGQKLALHDFFLAKSVDALKPGGVLALITSHYTLDKQNAALREQLAGQADFLGAIRLPSDAFKQEGTRVVTDILFLHKRETCEAPRHAHDGWLETATLTLEGAAIPVNRYFLEHPEMVLGAWSRENRLYGSDMAYSVTGAGDLAAKLRSATAHLPRGIFSGTVDPGRAPPDAAPFTPPPALPHIDEGSFFAAENQTLMQVQAGEAVSVTHGDKPLKADGTMMGKRLAALIALRDQARRVLQSQNEDWPDTHRHEARRSLNRFYDRFVGTYGPVNKTTLSVTAKNTTVRRMPNLVKFRDDPDAMLVMSLEHYDEATGTAEKAAIMHQDVVGRSPPVTSVESAEDGLLVCLDQLGKVDLPYIARLYQAPLPRIMAELGDLIYQDPETKDWETADVYLSGNVRAKLLAAEAAGPDFARNAEALRQVQPEDVLPGDIDANLGAPWIPEADIQGFAAHLFGVQPDSIQVVHLKKDAVWSIDADLSAVMSVAASTEFGTERMGGVRLLELALNLKSPAIYDTVMEGGKEERVLNQEATLAAREKQKRIKDSFRGWIFSDPERTERLVRRYNDIYNNIRLRLFDGSHLAFPGMNRTIALQPHQKDAVWRCMSSGNALLAHAVGAGKTYEMAAAGMKMKQAGLIQKPMYVVPNHMLEQFARECLQLYPNARFLIAGRDDLARQRRKLLTAKIASGEWDGIIVTHSSFERIGMSQGYQADFLREQIADYEQLLCDSAQGEAGRARRNIIKTIEKQKARREERLQDLLAEDKKDDGLVFDELGVDHLFIDESHYYKNLETPTKMDRVAGIQTAGSERAFDLFMKARYLHRRHAGHGLTFATGTPISNTMVEMYTVQRYLDPDGLSARGIDHFDAWAATFGEVVETMEISPDGKSLRPRSRFARFTNLPELQQMFRAVADVQTAEMLDLPRPNLKGGKAGVISCPMSEEQRLIQEQLVERYDRLRTQKVDPREDNALAITTDGRKLALDARLIAPGADDPGSKINALVETVTAIWQQTAGLRGTQMIFSDMGVRQTPWGYSVYDDLIAKLLRNGIPREQIAAVGDADTDAKKQVLFDKVRAGSVRVLIGSTQKMGTGTNVQKRLAALHHLDAPWKPAEVEQRDGRILRQGNMNEEVSIYRYVTEGSFDAYMWQALETKARFIAQVITGDSTARQAEDIGGQELSYAEVKAIASGNPAVLTLAEADAELGRLMLLKKHHSDEQYLARQALRDLPDTIARLDRRLDGLKQDRETAEARQGDPLIIDGRRCPKDEVQKVLSQRLKTVPASVIETRRLPLGVYRGLEFGLNLSPFEAPDVYLKGATLRRVRLSRDHQGPRAILNAVERLAGTYDVEHRKAAQDLSIAQGQLRDFEARLGAQFAHEIYLDELTSLRDQLELGLSGTEPVEGIVTRIMDLRAAHTVEAAPERTVRAAAAEEPVTARIRQRVRPTTDTAAPEETAVPPPAATSSPLTTLFNLPHEPKPKTLRRRRTQARKGQEASSQLSLF